MAVGGSGESGWSKVFDGEDSGDGDGEGDAASVIYSENMYIAWSYLLLVVSTLDFNIKIEQSSGGGGWKGATFRPLLHPPTHQIPVS